ncbi:MAG: FeoA family protein [Saprospiraceae bacterium]
MTVKKGRLLSELKVKTKGNILGFTDELISSRLLTMGILPGSQIELIRKAPLRGGFYIKFDNQRIALRSIEAASILVAVSK